MSWFIFFLLIMTPCSTVPLINRVLSDYLGPENMLAIVCKTYEGVKELEKYDKEGMIDKSYGLQGIGKAIGRHLDGRYLVFCIENLRCEFVNFFSMKPSCSCG